MIGSATRSPWFEAARRELGVREIVGAKHNLRVLQYHAETRLKALTDEVAWCSSFLNWVFAQVDMTPTRSAAASSWSTWGQTCPLFDGAFLRPDGLCIAPDAVLVFGKHDLDAKGTGHVALCDHIDPDGVHVWVLGGNQQNGVNVAKRRIADIVASRWPLVS